MTRRSPRGAARAGALLVMLALLAGCVSLPEAGPVRTRAVEDPGEQGQGLFDFAPEGPRTGASRIDIVNGFLQAMRRSPQSTATAREFLTDESSSRWVPERGTLVYGSQVLTETRAAVTAELEEPVALDGRGAWLGEVGDGQGVRYRLRLIKEDGEWRISAPPDLLMIPRSHFETRYEQFFLYFFDRTAQILVPEPVYLPTGEQAPTLLVRRLLRGPDPEEPGVTRTFLPPGTELELSVPVGRDGTAEIPLSDDIRQLGNQDLQMALAQLAWTLRQVPGVETMRVTVDGAPLDIPGERGGESVQAWTEFDPSIHWASQELFGIRAGRVVALSADGNRQVESHFGSSDHGFRSIAVDFPAEQVAGVAADGRSVVVVPRSGRPAEESGAPPEEATTVYSSGKDLLRPAWDLYGQIWLVDRDRGRARLVVLRSGVPFEVTARGISGRDVTSFTVSRDGTRLVAVVDDERGDRLLVARVVRRDDGRVRAVTLARDLPLGPVNPAEIRDVAWVTPGSLVVLTGPATGTSQVRVVPVDGSSLPAQSTDAEILRERSTRVVASPSPGSPLYLAVSRGQVYELASDGQWVGPRLDGPLLSPAFVG